MSIAGEPQQPSVDASDEVSADAMQLVNVAVFNGLCRLISALARNGLIDVEQLRDIHDAMTCPLDDEEWRDDEFITMARTTAEKVLSAAVEAASC